MPVYSSLTRAPAEALVDVLWFVDGCEDEQMDPDDAVKALEGVAHLVTQLSSDRRADRRSRAGRVVLVGWWCSG